MADERKGNGPAWRELALDLRAALHHAGVYVEPCGPGEPQDCGGTFAHHCYSYMAALQAKAESGLRHLHHGDPAGIELAQHQLEHWRAVFAAEDEHTEEDE